MKRAASENFQEPPAKRRQRLPADLQKGYALFYSRSKIEDVQLPNGNWLRGDWRRHLSNFHMLSEPLLVDGERYPSVEHYFQSRKFLWGVPKGQERPDIAFEFTVGGTYGSGIQGVKAAGGKTGFKKHKCRFDARRWMDKRTELMIQAIRYRYEQDAVFRDILDTLGQNRIVPVHFAGRAGPNEYWGCQLNKAKIAETIAAEGKPATNSEMCRRGYYKKGFNVLGSIMQLVADVHLVTALRTD